MKYVDPEMEILEVEHLLEMSCLLQRELKRNLVIKSLFLQENGKMEYMKKF